MMALHHHHHHHHHLSAAADYCRHFSAPPAIGYGDSGHYLPRLTGAEPVLKPPLSLFSHPQQPFPHLDPLPPLGPPPMGPTPGLCPGPPPALGPPLCPAPALPPPLTSLGLCPPPGHTLVPPPLAPNTQLPPPPHLPPHFPPTPCREPTPSLPNVPPNLAPAPISAQAAPESEQPHGESSSLGSEEQDDPLGLEELCKPLYCKLCNVTLNSTQQAQAHYQGKNHSKKLRNFYAGREQPPAIRITDSDCNEGDTTRQSVFKGAARVILATENDYCKLCDASFSSAAVAQAHYQGKNHAKRLRLQEAHNNSEGSSEVMPKRSRKEDYRLLKHRSQLPSPLTGPYFHARPRPRIPRDLAMCVTPSGSFYCSMCNSGAEQEPDFRQHLESKQHKAKVSELRYRNEMVTLGYS